MKKLKFFLLLFFFAFVLSPLKVDAFVLFDKLEPVIVKDSLRIEIDLPELLPQTVEEIKAEAETEPSLSLISGQWQDYILSPEAKLDQEKISDNVQTDLYTGAAQYFYTLDLPQGRNGIAPNLSLKYNSQNKNPFSHFALGWELEGLEFISRDSRNGIDSAYDDGKFIFSAAGELKDWVLTDSMHGEYRLLVDNGEYYRFFYKADDSWEMIDKEGVHYYFALTADSKEGGSKGTFKWYLEKIEDNLGNNCLFEYKKKDGVSMLDKITYSNFENETGVYEIDFFYYNQRNELQSYQKGFKQIYIDKLSSIKLKVNNILVRSYVLDYEDNKGDLLLLKSIQERFYKDGNTLSYEALDPVHFEYEGKIHDNWLERDLGEVDFSFKYPNGVNLADINNDALSDVIESNDIKFNNGSVIEERKTFLNSISGDIYNENPNWNIPLAFYDYYQNGYHYYTDTILTDFNGDRELDLVHKNNVHIFDKNTEQWVQDLNYTSFDLWRFIDNQKEEAVSMADLNGDNLKDFIFNKTKNTYLNKWAENGNALKANWITMPIPLEPGVKLIDVNNDGLDDIVKSIFNENTGQSEGRTFLNKGDGTWQEVFGDFISPLLFIDKNDTTGDIHDHYVLAIDINNDGFVDIVDARNRSVYLNNFNGWDRQDTFEYDLPVYLANNSKLFDFRWGEADGKAGVDIWMTEAVGDSFELKQYLNQSDELYLLKEIRNEFGAKIKIDYTTSAFEKDNKGAISSIVKKITVDDGFAQQVLEEYEYEGAENYYESIWRSYKTGFAKITKTFFDGHKEEYYFHQGQDNYSKKGKLYLHKIFAKNNNLLRENYSKWNSQILSPGNNYFVYLDESIEKKYGTALSASVSSVEKYFYDNLNGNINKIIDYNQVTLYKSWAWRDLTAGDNKYFYYEYARDRKNSIRAALKSERIEDVFQKVFLEKKYYYDNLSFGGIYKGLLSKEEILKDENNNWISKSYEYNKYGLNISQSDFKGNINKYVYDQYNLFPIEQINALGHKLTKEYDYACSTVVSEKNENSQILYSDYDSLCRPVANRRVNKNTGEEEILNEIEYIKQWPNLIKEKIYTDQNIYTELNTFYDGLNRPVLIVSNYEQNRWKAILNQYNLHGLVTKRSKSFPVNNSSWQNYNPIQNLEFSYDELNRLIKYKDSKHELEITYKALSKSILLNNKIEKEYSFDLDRNFIRAEENDGTINYFADYKYDILGNLISVEDSADNIRNFEYDKLGNLIYNEDSHYKADGYFLYWTYLWDDNSNLIKKNNVLANTFLTYRYDKLNRLIQEDDSVTAYLDWNYIYDGGPLGEGKLSSMKSKDYEKSYLYNWQGSVIRESNLIDGKLFTYFYKYNYFNYPTEVVYPDNSKLFNSYNNQSLLKSSSIDVLGKRTDIVRNRIYNKDNKLITELLGNSTRHNYEYDNNDYLISEEILNSKSDLLYRADYSYDDFDNLHLLNYSGLYIPNYHAEFLYDDLFRLKESTIIDENDLLVKREQYKYGASNNLISTGNSNFDYTFTGNDHLNPYAFRSITDNNNLIKEFEYDKQGNVSRIDDTKYSWDAANFLLSVEEKDNLITYRYDSDNNLVNKAKKDFNYYFIGNYNTDDAGNENIYYGNYLRRMRDGKETAFYQYKDKFNNLVLELYEDASLENYYLYGAYGAVLESLKVPDDNTALYRDKKRDLDSGLDYVNSRFYNHETYHWMSLDPAYENLPILDLHERSKLLAHPTWMNPYMYNAYNPYRYEDSDGEWIGLLVDIVSVAWSAYDFVQDPTAANAAWLAADVAAAVAPFVPASKTSRITAALVEKANKYTKVVSQSIQSTAKFLGKNYNETVKLINKATTEISNAPWARKAVAWGYEGLKKGIGRLGQHFVKHGDDLGKFNLNNIDEYFKFSSDFLGRTGEKYLTDHGMFYKLKQGTDNLFFNPHNGLLVVVKNSKTTGYVRSFYQAGKSKGGRFLDDIKDLWLRWTYQLLRFAY